MWFIWFRNVPIWGSAVAGTWVCIIRLVASLPSSSIATIVYSGPDTLQKIVDAFYEQNCAMVVGTYRMTDFKMNEIPPGIIDHREWTLENGRNNALRINGLGAPRAFYTPVLRRINLPNTSYGEDYALGLRISAPGVSGASMMSFTSAAAGKTIRMPRSMS